MLARIAEMSSCFKVPSLSSSRTLLWDQGQTEPSLDQPFLRRQAIDQCDLHLLHTDRSKQPLQKATKRFASARGWEPDPFLAPQQPLGYPLADQRMSRRADDPHRLDPDDAGDQLSPLIGMVPQAERHLAAPHQVANLLARRSPQIELDRRGTPSELAQHLDDVGIRQGTDERQRHGAANLVDYGLYRLPPVLNRRQHCLCKRQKGPPGLGQTGAAMVSVEKRRAKFLLDQANTSADRGLRPMEPIGRPREAAELCDRDKGPYFVDVHVDQ
jgi:hypothetical protein